MWKWKEEEEGARQEVKNGTPVLFFIPAASMFSFKEEQDLSWNT